MDEKNVEIELMKDINILISENVKNYLEENNIKDTDHENSDRLTNFLQEGIKNELETNFSIDEKLELLNDKELLKDSIEHGINSLIEIETKDFNDAWEKVSNGTSKEELIFNGFDEKLVDTAIKLETFSRDNEIDLSTKDIETMNYSRATEIVKDIEIEITNRDNLFAAHNTENKETLDKLADSDNILVLNAVAENENTSKETFEKLLDKNDDTVNWHIATNNNAPEEILDRLADSDQRLIKMEVAGNSNTAPETLDRLASDDEFIVKLNVAENKNSASETLELLASDNNEKIREAVLDNPNSSERAKDIAEKINEISSSNEVSSNIKTEEASSNNSSYSYKM